MSDETIDLFIRHELERKKRDDDAFWEEVNELAEKYEVTVDYILMEFV